MPQAPTQIESAATEHRRRLLEGMAHALAVKGYADTTISDVVREAGVSRRTFYEHFSTRAECLIALYEAASLSALNVLRDAIDPAHQWETQAEQAMAAYLGCLSQNPLLTRTLFIEILGSGMAGLEARRRVNRQIAVFMLAVVNTDKHKRRRKTLLSEDMAMAIVGGINELILQYIERDRVSDLHELAGPAICLLKAVASGNPEAAAVPP